MSTAKILRFAFQEMGTGEHGLGLIRTLWARFHPGGARVLNRTEWRGLEPRSCCILGAKTKPHAANDPAPIDVEVDVEYRPKGYISYTGRTRYDAWTAMLPRVAEDGTPLDAEGNPVRDGIPQGWIPQEVLEDIEFNDVNFGELVEEIELGVKHMTLEELWKEMEESRSGFASADSSFVAAHRNRPRKKIILSNAPSGQAIERSFGTHIININLSTPSLEHVLMDELWKLMCEYVEGKASIKTVGNAELTFVALSDALVDCEPNELELDSWFDVLHMYTPLNFLDDLAQRLTAKYLLDVIVISGKSGGLVLRKPEN